MTRRLFRVSIGIQTAEELSRRHRRLDRQPGGVWRVWAAMKDGASLHCEFRNGRRIWWLSTGEFVPNDVAMFVAVKPEIVAVGDALFGGIPSQTYRYVNAD